MRKFACVLVLAGGCAYSEDAGLDGLRAMLESLRPHAKEHLETRGATEQLTIAKHQMRDWIESRLMPLRGPGDVEATARSLNDALRQAKLTYDSIPADPTGEPGFWTEIGYVGDVQLEPSDLLVVRTSIGIQCGEDQSAYLYEWRGDRWQRRWQSEQNDYTEEQYSPQTLRAVLVSRANRKSKDHIVVTLGVLPWCSSAWRSVYYRAWRLGPDNSQAKLLLNKTEGVYLGDTHGSVNADDVLIEFSGVSIDTGVLVREMIRHFVVDGEKVDRVAPIALSPRDFVDEWLTQPWSEARRWSEGAQLQQWHKKLHKDRVFGEFIYPTLHCGQNPDLWQVGVSLSEPQTTMDRYFLVRWRPPYRFAMVQVSDEASPKCAEEDRDADEQRTLFPVQN